MGSTPEGLIGIGIGTYGNGHLLRLFGMAIERGPMTSSHHDHKLFPTATIARGERPTALPVQPTPELATLSPELLKALDDTSARGYLVLRRGAKIHESYFRGHGPQLLSNSFSMAKPVVTLLVGAAIA